MYFITFLSLSLFAENLENYNKKCELLNEKNKQNESVIGKMKNSTNPR